MKFTIRRVTLPLFTLVVLTVSQYCAAQQPAAAPVQVPVERLAAYVGVYHYDDDSRPNPSISLEGANLYIESSRTPKQLLIPQSVDSFSPNGCAVGGEGRDVGEKPWCAARPG